MPRDFSRTRRVEEQLRRDLSDLIRSEVKEPDLGMISITSARVTTDLSQAKIYISIMQDDAEVIAYTMEVLQHYAGRLRGILGKRMRMRTIPQLQFIYDDLIQQGSQMNNTIEQAVERDQEKAESFGTDMHEDQTEEDKNG